MRKVLLVVAVLAMALPAFGQTAYFGNVADGAFDTYRGGAPDGGYGNNGQGGAPRIGKYNQHMGYLSFYGATADGSGQTIDQFVQANGGWSNPNLQVTLHFRAIAGASTGATGGLPAVGWMRAPAAEGAGGNEQVGMWLESVRVGMGAGAGGLVEDQSASSGGDFAYTAPAAGYQGASEPQAFRGAAPYLPSGAFANLGEGITAGPLSTPAGVAWYTPSGFTGSHGGITAANSPVWWAGGAGTPAEIGWYSGKGTWAVEYLLGHYGNNGYARAGALDANGNFVAGTNDWAQAGQIVAKDSNGNPIVLTSQYYNPADPRGLGGSNANNVTVPLDATFAQDMATNPENRGMVFDNAVSILGADSDNTAIYSRNQGGQWCRTSRSPCRSRPR